MGYAIPNTTATIVQAVRERNEDGYQFAQVIVTDDTTGDTLETVDFRHYDAVADAIGFVTAHNEVKTYGLEYCLTVIEVARENEDRAAHGAPLIPTLHDPADLPF